MARKYIKKRKNLRKKRFAKKIARGATKRRGSIAMRRLIQAEIARENEDKSTQVYNLAKTIVGVASPTFQDNIFQVGPNATISDPMNITQGTGVASRIGNKIRTTRLVLKGTLVPLPYHATTNYAPAPVQVRMVIFYDRTTPTSEPQVASNFFQQAGANAGFYNDLTDLWRPYNTDRYRIVAQRTFKLGFANNGGTGAQPAYQNMSNNDFKLNQSFKFNLTKKYPKVVKFDENSPAPTTRGLWCLVYYVAASGNVIPADQAMVEMQWMIDYRYEDS